MHFYNVVKKNNTHFSDFGTKNTQIAELKNWYNTYRILFSKILYTITNSYLKNGNFYMAA